MVLYFSRENHWQITSQGEKSILLLFWALRWRVVGKFGLILAHNMPLQLSLMKLEGKPYNTKTDTHTHPHELNYSPHFTSTLIIHLISCQKSHSDSE